MKDPASLEELTRQADAALASDEHQADIVIVLRSVHGHHVSLSMIADQKANIVLGSYLVFLTVTQSLMKENTELSIPVWVLTIGFTVAALFALAVIKPRFREKKQKPGDTPSNLLFFGSFSSLSEDEYIDMLSQHSRTNQDARRLLMKDIYQMGKVIHKKYQNLRHSYTCLAAGILAALVALVITNFI